MTCWREGEVRRSRRGKGNITMLSYIESLVGIGCFTRNDMMEGSNCHCMTIIQFSLCSIYLVNYRYINFNVASFNCNINYLSQMYVTLN